MSNEKSKIVGLHKEDNEFSFLQRNKDVIEHFGYVFIALLFGCGLMLLSFYWFVWR